MAAKGKRGMEMGEIKKKETRYIFIRHQSVVC